MKKQPNPEQSSRDDGVDWDVRQNGRTQECTVCWSQFQLFRRMPQTFVPSLSYDIYNTGWYFIVAVYENGHSIPSHFCNYHRARKPVSLSSFRADVTVSDYFILTNNEGLWQPRRSKWSSTWNQWVGYTSYIIQYTIPGKTSLLEFALFIKFIIIEGR